MMKILMRPNWTILVGAASFTLLFPSVARADGIDIGMVAVGGAIVLIPLLIFEMLVEAIVFAVGFKVRYREVLLVALGANLASLLAGIPVKISNAFMYPAILPHELASYFLWYPWAVLLGTAIYFLVTFFVELLVVVLWCRREAVAVSFRRIALVVLLANVAAYAVLGPWHYYVTRPINNILAFTNDSSWAHRPATTLYYLDGDSGNLCSISTDGQDRRVLVPDTVKDYQFREDGGWFLYRNGSDALSLYRKGGKPKVCCKPCQPVTMDEVACNAEGTIVGCLTRADYSKPFELVLCDPNSDRAVRTGIETPQYCYDVQITWSNAPDILFLKLGRDVQAYRIGRDLSATPVEVEPAARKLLPVIGRFKNEYSPNRFRDYGVLYEHDVSGPRDAMTFLGLESHLRVKLNDEHTIILADNPGLLHLPRRGFGNVCFLDNGRELIFDDHEDIYLMDLNERKVGRIAHGLSAITASSKFQRKLVDDKQ
jgi:hypothetical protein